MTLSDLEIIDNRNNKCDLEIDEFGNGKWYVWNKRTDEILALRTKQDAINVMRDPVTYGIS